MTTAVPTSVGRSRFGVLLAAGQVRYQLLLLLRSPIGTFTTLVVPLMLLVALNVVTPETALRELHGIPYANFLTPAMATFALVNGCYVNVITSVVVAREGGVLKRLHGTPLPLWAYAMGRMASAAVISLASIVVVFAVGVIFMHVHLDPGRVAALAGVAGLGVATFTTLGLAVSSLIPRPDTALPVAYGTLLPVAFVSDVFFPATAAPHWLQHLSASFPLSPIAKSAERIFASDAGGWPMSRHQLIVTLAWIAGAALVTSLTFRWQPSSSPRFAWFRRLQRH